MRPGDTPIRNTDTPNVQATTVPCSIIAVVWFSSWISSLIVYACCSGCPSPLRSTGSRCPRKGAAILWQLCSVPSLASAAVCYRPQLRAGTSRYQLQAVTAARTGSARTAGARAMPSCFWQHNRQRPGHRCRDRICPPSHDRRRRVGKDCVCLPPRPAVLGMPVHQRNMMHGLKAHREILVFIGRSPACSVTSAHLSAGRTTGVTAPQRTPS